MPTKRKNTKVGSTQPLQAPSTGASQVKRAQRSAAQSVPQGATSPIPQVQPQAAQTTGGQAANTGVYESVESMNRPEQAFGRGSSVRKRSSRPPIALIAILAIVVILLGLFSWQRWFRYSDVQDIQGTWIVQDSAAQIVITEDTMTFIEDTSYKYTMNETAKTLSYSFSNLSGSSHYRFSLDRSKLVVMEKTGGKSYGSLEAFGNDLAWTVRALVAHIMGSELDPSDGLNADRASWVLLSKGA